MPSDIGFSSQTPSLPGGGGLSGLGETFTPDLSMGTGSFRVPLDIPNGPNDIAPKLSLRYDSAGSNGAFGLGWSIPMPRIVRSTAGRHEAVEPADSVILEGSGPLITTADGTLRPQVETGVWQV